MLPLSVSRRQVFPEVDSESSGRVGVVTSASSVLLSGFEQRQS
jgi:hypothetical protein